MSTRAPLEVASRASELPSERTDRSTIREFTVLVALFALLVFAVFDMGRAFLVRTDLDDAARAGALAGALSDGDEVQIRHRVIDSLTRVEVSRDAISVVCLADAASDELRIEVAIEHRHRLVTPVLSWIVPPLDMSVSSNMQRFAPGNPCR